VEERVGGLLIFLSASLHECRIMVSFRIFSYARREIERDKSLFIRTDDQQRDAGSNNTDGPIQT